jgi:hypothetical protein
MSDPVKVVASTNAPENGEIETDDAVAQEKREDFDEGDDEGEDDEPEIYSDFTTKKINKIITLKLVVQYTDALSLEGIKKG